MPRTRSGSPPSYRLYKRTGQAVVTLDGRDHYLGAYGSLESKQDYNRLIAAWLARQEAVTLAQPPLPCTPPVSGSPTINEVILSYLTYATAYYKPSEGARTRRSAASASSADCMAPSRRARSGRRS